MKQGKADRCHALLEDPDLKQAFADVRERLLEELIESTGSDEYLLDLRKCVQLLGVVKQKLYQAVQEGKLEQYNENQTPFLQDLTNVRH